MDRLLGGEEVRLGREKGKESGINMLMIRRRGGLRGRGMIREIEVRGVQVRVGVFRVLFRGSLGRCRVRVLLMVCCSICFVVRGCGC